MFFALWNHCVAFSFEESLLSFDPTRIFRVYHAARLQGAPVRSDIILALLSLFFSSVRSNRNRASVRCRVKADAPAITIAATSNDAAGTAKAGVARKVDAAAMAEAVKAAAAVVDVVGNEHRN